MGKIMQNADRKATSASRVGCSSLLAVPFPFRVLERMWMRHRLGKEKEKMYWKFLKYSCR